MLLSRLGMEILLVMQKINDIMVMLLKHLLFIVVHNIFVILNIFHYYLILVTPIVTVRVTSFKEFVWLRVKQTHTLTFDHFVYSANTAAFIVWQDLVGLLLLLHLTKKLSFMDGLRIRWPNTIVLLVFSRSTTILASTDNLLTNIAILLSHRYIAKGMNCGRFSRTLAIELVCWWRWLCLFTFTRITMHRFVIITWVMGLLWIGWVWRGIRGRVLLGIGLFGVLS